MRLFLNKITAIVAVVLMIALAFASTIALQRTANTEAVVVGTPVSLGEVVVEDIRETPSQEEIMWLARCIYSETKQPHEQELVAWVLRNRMETGYRGKHDYRSVVLDPWQFSAFNINSPKRKHYMSLNENSAAAGWKTAMQIAERVALAYADERPFSVTTRHFYSERSMVGGRKPKWAYNRQPVKLDRDVDPRRFRFFADIA